ncbi:MAG: tRNA (adenosine(37)-N6)-threonylcarbamoyltransferase complex ATPase subunit type 1 TsaE [Ignavibacteriae bacterium]|nr:tRNA (adenosine(37)-N6)-threonylcarbamoyltransferase complex ATPase subunit type 1 TsaE [Ignavibacteriota bacterium]
MKLLRTHNELDTINAGTSFARELQPGDIVACYGDLGSGKTRFIKGICEGLGVHEHVASPTFTIINMYNSGNTSIYHFDLYRINSLDELYELGFEEYTNSDGICLIEWAEKANGLLPQNRYDVHFQLGETENEREISINQITDGRK